MHATAIRALDLPCLPVHTYDRQGSDAQSLMFRVGVLLTGAGPPHGLDAGRARRPESRLTASQTRH